MNKIKCVKLTIEYDGTNYVGWQIQPNGISVQQVLETALNKLTHETSTILASGRTDAGVHALGQVVHFNTSSNIKEYQYIRGLNFYLPNDVSVIKAEFTSPQFHSRYDAKKRTYQYFISLQPSSVYRNFRWVIIDKLNISQMKKALPFLLGKHDFKSFCSNKSTMDNYFCEIYSCNLKKINNELIFQITGSRFLHNMVRAIIGTLVEIGRGKLKYSEMENIIKAKDRVQAGPTAPPNGLFLIKVDY